MSFVDISSKHGQNFRSNSTICQMGQHMKQYDMAQARKEFRPRLLSQEVGDGVVGTRGTLGGALRREVGAGAQVTHSDFRAALSRDDHTGQDCLQCCA
jgi:hypothetical protein